MSQFEKRVQLNKIIESQLPEFLVADFPKAIEFFRQYYLSLEHQGGSVDLVDNLDRYIRVDNLVPEVVVGETALTASITSSQDTIQVTSTKGFPDEYGLLQIGDEIVTYKAKTDTEFTGCVRGFSGISGYDVGISTVFSNVNRQNVIFSETSASAAANGAVVKNLSVIFLQEFYKKLKKTFTPGLEEYDFVSDLDVGNFIKHARNFYQSKGIAESVKILFKVLYGVNAEVLDLESRLIKPSSSEYIRRELIVAENISGDPFGLEGQTIFKSNDLETNASVSDVEIFTRNNQTFYKLGVFVGYNDRDLVEGIFTIPGASRVLEPVEVNANVISVDSTIGFGQTGTIISGTNRIDYTSKSINQFYGCTGVTTKINLADVIRADETIFGYENGDIENRCDMRITGVLSEFKSLTDIPLMEEDEKITTRNVGEIIENPIVDRTYKQMFANSWMYNTSPRFKVEEINSSVFTLFSDIDKAYLKVGDSVEVLIGESQQVVVPDPTVTNASFATVSSINTLTKEVTLSNIGNFVPDPNKDYSIRRKVVKAKSSGVVLTVGNEVYIANASNIYTDDAATFGYLASNSLPGYKIVDDIVESTLPDGYVQTLGPNNTQGLGGYNPYYKTYETIVFSTPVDFRDGDEIVYTAQSPLIGLTSGDSYFVKLVAANEIKLYASKSQLANNAKTVANFDDISRFNPNFGAGAHNFTLKRHENRTLSSKQIVRKFPLVQQLESTKSSDRTVSNVGVLIDGVEIVSPDSTDKIYYGPVEEFEVLNGGKGYDVVNPPQLTVEDIAQTGSGLPLGSGAKVEPVVIGSVKQVFVDPQDFGFDKFLSLDLVGGNGSGCLLEPVIGSRFREISFDSRNLNVGGGIDPQNETITFTTNHNLADGEHIIYNQNGNDPIEIGEAYDPNNIATGGLSSGDEYVVRVVNTSTIRLFKNDTDAFTPSASGITTISTGINTIGLSAATSASGIHKFRTLSQKNVRSITVLDGGSGYAYRKLRVKSSGISTEYNTIYFKNHGFKTGEVVTYQTTGNSIVGLSTLNSYSIQFVDSDQFRLVNVGVAGTFADDLNKSKYTKLDSIGSGYHIFQYPEIKVNANVSFGSAGIGTFTFTPIVTGEIADAYLYESGAGYGSTIFNLHTKPRISLSKGKNSQLAPIISNGRIVDIQVLNKGSEYDSIPELRVEDPSGGTGAILRPVLLNGKIDDVVVINAGIGYSASSTSIFVDSRGSGAIFDTRVRDLTVNDAFRFGKISATRTPEIYSSLYKDVEQDSLVYGMYGYSEDLASNFEPLNGSHSPIIGWAYDGNPIYGPFGYQKADNVQSGVTRLETGYELKTNSVVDRPPTFEPGFFKEDYLYTNSGDLDVHNGRFCKTPEFPNGVYAYFVGVTTSGQNSAKFAPAYPYFIGNKFKSQVITDNLILDHKFDFNGNDLVRNTFPYKVNDPNADYDFINESYESFEQLSTVDAVTKGTVGQIKVIDGGVGYSIGDRVNFDFEGTGGTGLRGEVQELKGAGISSITTDLERNVNCVFVWDNDNQVSAYNREGYDFNNNDTVLISGLSTSIPFLSGPKRIGFTTEAVGLAGTMTSYSGLPGGKFEDIFVSRRFREVSIGNSITITSSDGTETVKVLNDHSNGVLTVKRFGSTGVAHSFGSDLSLSSDRVRLPVKSTKFESRRDKLIYFNARTSVGVGTTAGGAQQKVRTIGVTTSSVSVPCRAIYLPNHGLKTGERLTFTKSTLAGVDSLIVADNSLNQGSFFIPDTNSLSSEVFVINKGENFIGLTTQVGLTTASEGLFFYSDGSNNSEYLLKTNRSQVLGNVDRITTIVSTSSTHGLQNRDVIKLTVAPNTVVGFGTTGALNIKLNEDEKKILVNTIGINSTGISLSDGSFTYQDHGYKTGDKVFYEATEVASGLTTGTYYVIQDSIDKFRLAETLFESNPRTENAVSISAKGGVNHYVSAVNPPIDVVRNSDLKFNLQDVSLRGYQLKIYRDKHFTNEYISSGDSRDFNVVGLGSVGFGTASDASLTLSYSDSIPSRLYYALEKGGYISTADTEVKAYSEIRYENSEYNGTYSVFGISTTSSTTEFKISPYRYPNVLSYSSAECDTLEYNTRSANALNGSISKVKVIAEGFNFDKLPQFKDVTSKNGINANIVAISTSIGRIKKTRIRDVGYDYSADRTLRPEAFVPPIVTVDNLDTIQEIDIEFAGAKYLSDPDVILWNDTTKQVVDTTTLVAKAPNGSIAEIEQLAPIFGLESEPHKIITINNSNGVGIVSMVSGPTGIATCVLKTPILGYNQAPFAVNDRVFVEGIEMGSPDGSGFNSSDYNYQLFKVTQFANTSPATLTFQLVDDAGVGLTTNAGIAKTYQSGYATLINENIYPRITIKQDRGTFTKNERLFVNSDGNGFRSEDAFVSLVRDDYIKYTGRYSLKKGDIIKGIISGVVAKVTNIDRKRAKFVIDYSSRVELGWSDDIGKISEDYQVTPNNDYYQNLSYSIKSPITWDEFSTPVNSVIHPAGLKNFADVGVTSTGKSGVGLGGSTTSIVILDVVNERRVDTINNFDNAVDVDPRVSPVTGLTQSNALQIQNRKLTDYIECRTNRVLIHDDISNKFSSRGFKDTFVEIEEIDFIDNHVRYVIQIADPDTKDLQLTELIVQSTTNDIFAFEKYTSFTNNKLGDFSANIDSFGRKTLIFTPTDPYETDHDIKVLKKTYLFQALPPGNSGIGTQTIGSVDLVSSFVGLSSVPGGKHIGTLAEFTDNDFNGLFASIEISNRFSGETNYVEATIDFDGTDTYVSEYYFDLKTQSYSVSNVGLVSAIYDANSGIVSVRGRNFDQVDAYDYRTHIIGFGNTTSGIGTYRFLLNNQPAGTERSARLESTIGFGTDKVRVGTFDSRFISAAAAVVRVSAGTTSAIHQVNILSNSRDSEVTVTPGPFAPVNNITGLGTFGGEISGNDFYLNFYPDAGYDVEAQAFSEVFYREMDFDNQANPLSYGPTSQLLFLSAFDGLNGLRANRTNFTLTHDGKPIYVKNFDPADTAKINYATGVFTLEDHFFNTGEELIYRPKSSFIGVGTGPMGIGATVNHLGIVTDKLPDRVYPIALTPDTFKLSTTPQFAAAGISVTFTDAGVGNSHELEFTKKLSKTVIAIDGIVQQPIAFTPINHTLDFNGHYSTGGIPTGISTFNISGISSIQPRDLLRIDDEYMKVVEVGLSTNVNGEVLGPINGLIAAGVAATFPTVAVERGSVGSAATSHIDGSEVRVYRGALNIVGNEVHFIEPPKGNNRARRNESNLPYVTAQFSGRTFLRSDYDTNMVFDDVSDSFTGIGKTYTLKVGGADTTGVDAGNGILFINGVFQTPSTENNAGNNYEIDNDTTAGITSVIYTGITSVDGSFIQSDFDINQNQLPRGGLIVSLGSTPGLGYAPLLGAEVKVLKNSTGQLTDIIGINTVGSTVAVSTALYNNITGILEIETSDSHNILGGDLVKLDNLEFSCGSTGYGTTTIFPDYENPVNVVEVISATRVSIRVGPSTIPHTYETGGTVRRYFTNNFGSGYRSPVSIGVTDLAYEHKFVRSSNNSITASTGGPFTPTKADFTSHTGVLRLTIPNHGLDTTDTIQIATDSLIFTCSDDDFFTEQPYPRATDPAAGATLGITSFTTNTISVGVGSAGGSGTGAVVEATVGIGGTLAFSITSAGQGYINPALIIPEPNYENMEVVGVSRLGIGATTETGRNLLLNLEIDQSASQSNEDRFFDAANLILDNKAFIADIAYGRMNAAFPTFVTPTGNSQDCKDDIVDVLEATAYNLKYGGNDLTVDAGQLYITGAHVQGEEQQTINAFMEARDIAIQVMRNEPVAIGTHTNRNQLFDSTITYDTQSFTPTGATYTASNGNFVVTLANHGFQIGDQVKFLDNSFTFTCSKDNNATEHTYPRATDPVGSASTTNVTGYVTIDNVTTNTFRVNVGASPTGQQYTHTFVGASSGAVVYRLSSTTSPAQCANVASAIHTLVGIVTNAVDPAIQTTPTRNPAPGAQFNVSNFKVARSGYGFKPGDVLEVVGLVTAKDYTQPLAPFQLEVVETFTDRFSSWSFGEMDYIDSIFGYQDGNRKRFPLYYNGELLSFELDPNNPLSANIDLDSVLVIFVNGVLQTPGYAYQFTGGTSFMFMEAPKVNDKVDIFFYIGQDGVDVLQVETTETLKIGDDVRMLRQPLISSTEKQINDRAITEITGSDIIETNIYSGPGVDDTNFRPFDWIKQKKDIYVKGDIVSKVRPVLETKVFPTARIIGDVTPTSSEIFVDNAQFFDYDEIILDLNQNTFTFDAFMMETSNEPVSAAFTSTVSIAGTVSAVTIDNVGFGYTTSTIDIKFSAPKSIGVGVGTTATATATISNGQVSAVTITNPGFGYTNTNPPRIIAELPTPLYETINTVQNVQGFSGIITGISTTTGTGGHPLALKFNFRAMKDYGENGEANVASDALDLQAGYPIMIYDTTVGNGVTSVNSSDSAVVGIGTTFLDNVYVVNSITSLASNAEIICNVDSGSPVIGILESGTFDDLQAGLTTSLGKLSWGRIYNYDNRTNGISIGVTGLTVDAGLSTFPTIQRRGNFGEGKTGAVRSKKPRADGVSLEADNTLPFYIQ